jgi:hypothetical protein
MAQRPADRGAFSSPLRVAIAVIAVVCVHSVSGSQADRLGSVTVRVVDGITLKPIPAAVVQHVAPMTGPTVGPPPPLPSKQADAQGRVTFGGLGSGRHRFIAHASGFLDSPDGTPRSFGNVDVSSPGGMTIEIYLWPAGIIRGRVIDRATREPLVGVTISATALGPGRQPRRPEPTNDRGEFVVTDLASGQYVVGVPFTAVTVTELELRARAQRGGRAAGAPSGVRVGSSLLSTARSRAETSAVAEVVGDRVRVYRPAFWTNATNPASASPIDIRIGEHRSGVDLFVDTVDARRVTGTVIDPSGGLVEGASVRLYEVGGDSRLQRALAVAQSTVAGSGRFDLLGVAPGSYVLEVVAFTRVTPGRGRSSSTNSDLRYAEIPLTVADKDIERVELRLQPGPRLTGRVVLDEGRMTPEALRGARVYLQALPGPTVGRLASRPTPLQNEATLSPDGTVTAGPLMPGDYQIRVQLQGYELGWIRHQGRQVTPRTFTVRSDFTGAVFVLTKKFGPLQVTVDARELPPIGVLVTIFPADRASWPDARYDTTRVWERVVTDREPFTFRALPAGDYLVAASLVGTLPADWRQLPSIQALATRATRVTIAPGGSAVVRVPFGR